VIRLTVLVLAAQVILAAAVAEGVGAWVGSEYRHPIYAGGAAGVLLTLLGLPFALKLARLGETKDSSGKFWAWWGAGLLMRLFLLLGLALLLNATFREQPVAALLALLGSYLIGMFAEAGWLAAKLIAVDTIEK